MAASKRYLSSRFDVDSVASGRYEVRLSADGLLRIVDPKAVAAPAVVIFADDWLRIAEALKAVEVKR